MNEKILNINLKGKGITGFIDLEKKIYFSRRGREHFFHKFGGWGLSFSVMDVLQKYNTEDIILEIDNMFLKTRLSSFLVHGSEWNDGNDRQLILNLKYFNKNDKIKIIQQSL